MDWLERIGLNVRFAERQICQSRLRRVRAAGVKKGATAVETNDRPGWADPSRKFNRCITPTASDIQHVIAAMERQRRKHFCAMQMEAAGQDVPPRIEFWNQHGVPEFDILITGFDNPHGVHNQDARFLKVAFMNAIAVSVTCLAAVSDAIVSEMGFPPLSWLGHDPRHDTICCSVT